VPRVPGGRAEEHVLKEIAYFVWYGPRVGRQQAALGRAEFLEWLSAEVDKTGLGKLRHELIDGLCGDVLEVGAGSGAMFHRYGPDVRVTAIEPDDDFRAAAERAATGAAASIRVLPGTAEALAAGDGSMDAVVVSMVLCSVQSVPRALGEFQRVLKPGGQLRLLEHVRSDHGMAGVLMDVFNPVWLRLNQMGCHWNRRTVESVGRAGFRIESVTDYKLFHPALPAAFPWRLVKATK
jgi:ubiquinone/menaquinone biosynthesis C-methylase UbiE